MVALLREPVRRKLYEQVRRADHPVSREEAASRAGVSRSLAAFHLDKLAEAGLLEVEYRRLSGRTGRGAGRPAKLYRPSEARVGLSLPPTRYELAGELLLAALEDKAGGETPEAAAARVARRRGRQVGREMGARRLGVGALREVLEGLGFEPEEDGRSILLRNCPFHELMQRDPDVVCGMNGAFVGAILDELAPGDLRAEPCDREGYCCVMLQRA